jgi:hypothetical protein
MPRNGILIEVQIDNWYNICNVRNMVGHVSIIVKFEVLTVVVMNVAIFWDIVRMWTDVSEERITSIFRVEN